MNTTMEVNGLSCGFNMPPALNEAAFAQGLPPYAPQPAHKVDEYECPVEWMHGSGKASSYFVAVQPGKGMWLDFTRNEYHKHHVAVIVSIQGVNPLTGKKQMGFALEQYRDRCPVHECEFHQDRFCPQCGYKWPPQNYLATSGGGKLWIDGFMNAQGEVRQYVFTEDVTKGVAAQIIGNDRVFAIGVAFYLSKQPKPVQTPVYRSYAPAMAGLESMGGSPIYKGGPVTRGLSTRSLSAPPKQIEVAAGAKIKQEIQLDPEKIEFWEETPAGFLYVNYTDVETCNAILNGRKKDLTKGGEGFLADVTKYNQ